MEKVINYKEISSNFSQIKEIQAVYEESFPSEERREWCDLLALLDDEPRFHVLAACDADDESLAGFITFWEFDGFTYIEHLAVQPRLRGHGIGAALLAQVNVPARVPLLLEVEPPTGEMERRRIGFYNRAGLALRDDVDYVQPSYALGKPSVPLCLMVTPGMSHEDVVAAAHTLHKCVYRSL